MARLLVTGGAGFIGANFVHYWHERHPRDTIVVLDALTYAGNRASLSTLEGSGRFEFVHGDIADERIVAALLREHDIDTIVHFAAESHVDRSILGPEAFVRTNVTGTYRLLSAARAFWLDGDGRPHRFHHVSTDEVYGALGDEDPPFREDTPYAPNSPYAASKAASDHLVRAWHHTYGLQVTTSNCSNNYGPFQFPEKLIPLMILNALRGMKLPVYGEGRNTRDWLFVEDHCRGIDLVLEGGRIGETYNLGGRCERRNIDLVREICGIVDSACEESPGLAGRFPGLPPARGAETASLVEFVPDRPGHDWRYAIDCGKAERELGYAPRVALGEGLRRTFEWYVGNEAWWRPILEGGYRDWIRAQYEGG